MRTVIRERLREWRAANPEASRLLNIEAAHVRRCRKAGVRIERFNRDSIFVRDKGLCAYCGLGVDPQCWHLDHVIPIARGGGHTKSNVVASCPTCNMKKGAREVAA
jgi:5-methylcytosine-specific restriction endonuclease McrA